MNPFTFAKLIKDMLTDINEKIGITAKCVSEGKGPFLGKDTHELVVIIGTTKLKITIEEV